MKQRSLLWCPAVLILLVAAAFRLHALNWDGGIGAHPDERHVVGVAEWLRWPDRLNPFGADPSFAYGHLPVYLLALAGAGSGGGDLLLLGRGLAALFDLGTVALSLALARRLFGFRVGLLSAASIALAVQHIQQSHFFTPDRPLTAFSVAALLFAVRMAEGSRLSDTVLAGACAGLAIGSKASAALLVLPLIAACCAGSTGRASGWRRLGVAAAMALLAFAMTNPFALLAAPTYGRNLAQQMAIAQGSLDVPYTRQFHGTVPYIYPVVQQLRWAMGWVPGIVAFSGLAWTLYCAVRRSPGKGEWVVLAWTVPALAFSGGLYAKYPRYWLPVTPVLATFGARWILSVGDRTAKLLSVALRNTRRAGATDRLGAVAAALVVLVPALLRAGAFAGMYLRPHPWVAASRWFNEQVPPGAVIAVEAWDHPLPVETGAYDVRVVSIFDEDTPAKWERISRSLAEADYLVIASRRGYATLARWADRYPASATYYELLFAGQLGFRPVACFERYPQLGRIALCDAPESELGFAAPAPCRSVNVCRGSTGRLDESFVVYDHPRTIVFHRTATSPDPEEMWRMLRSTLYASEDTG